MGRSPSRPLRHLPERQPAKFATHTPFGQWMELLTRRRFVPKAAIDGIPVGFWHGFPVEEAVANGLMLVILDLARKADRRVESSDDVVEIAAKVDAMVAAGLSVGFANVRSAADAFVKKVVAPVHRAAQAGFRPDDPPSMATWKEIVAGRPFPPPAGRARARDDSGGEIGPFVGRPAALFFARLINGATRFRSRLEARLADLERANRLRGAVTWIPDSDFEFARRAIRRLDVRIGRDAARSREPGRPSGGHAPLRWGRWLETASALEACGRQIAKCRNWPVRLEGPLRGMQQTSVSEGWLDTVALMAIGRTKAEQDVLTRAAFWKAVSMIAESHDDAGGFASARARISRAMKARLAGTRPEMFPEIMDGIDRSLEKLPAAGVAYGKMMVGMNATLREVETLAAAVRKSDPKQPKARKDREAILEERNDAAERLERLQARVDREKEEFRANHFPAIFLPETNPEEALAGRKNR